MSHRRIPSSMLKLHFNPEIRMSRFLAALALLALAGCATCQRHPVACTVGAVIVAGSIAASIDHNHHARQRDVPSPRDPNCQQTPQACR